MGVSSDHCSGASRRRHRRPSDFLLLPALLLTFQAVPATAQVVDLSLLGRFPVHRDTLLAGLPMSGTVADSSRLAFRSDLTVREILELQTRVAAEQGFQHDIPSYYERGFWQLHPHGGRNGEMAFLIDGLPAWNPTFNVPLAAPNPAGLESITVITGGLPAGAWPSLGGVVNLVTREGRGTWRGSIEARSSEFSGTRRDDARNLSATSLYTGGTLPVGPGLDIFLSGSGQTSRDYLVRKDDIVFDLAADPAHPERFHPDITYDPADVYDQRGPDGRPIHPQDIASGWFGYGLDTSWDGLITLAFPTPSGGRLKLSLLRTGALGVPYSPSWRYSMLWGLPADFQRNAVLGTPRYNAAGPGDVIPGTGLVDYPNEKNVVSAQNGRITLVWTAVPRPDLHLSLRAGYQGIGRTMRVRRWVNAEGYGITSEHYYVPAGKDTLWRPEDPMTLVTLGPMPYSSLDSNARRYGYVPIGDAGLGNDGSDRYWWEEADIIRSLRGEALWQPIPGHQVTLGLFYNHLTLREHEIQLLTLDSPYVDDYYRHPDEAALWLQDRIEKGGLVVVAGLRWDRYWTDPWNLNSWYFENHPGTTCPWDPFGSDDAVEYLGDWYDPWTFWDWARVERIESALTPRFSVSQALSDRSLVHASWGRYVQQPPYRHLYISGSLWNSAPILGNPTLGLERTDAFDIGIRHVPTDRIRLDLTFWGRHETNLVGSIHIPAFFRGISNPYRYTILRNTDWGNSHGLDLSLTRRWSGHWSGRLDYSWLRSEMNYEDPWAGYRAQAGLEELPGRLTPVGWERRHRLHVSVQVALPAGAGPDFLGTHPLERTTMCWDLNAASGRPYTPTGADGTLLERNSARMPATWRVDLRIDRGLDLFGREASLFAGIRNLLDRRNVEMVYSRTGQPNDPGPGATGYSDSYDNSHYYGTPRTIDLGLRISF